VANALISAIIIEQTVTLSFDYFPYTLHGMRRGNCGFARTTSEYFLRKVVAV